MQNTHRVVGRVRLCVVKSAAPAVGVADATVIRGVRGPVSAQGAPVGHEGRPLVKFAGAIGREVGWGPAGVSLYRILPAERRAGDPVGGCGGVCEGVKVCVRG